MKNPQGPRYGFSGFFRFQAGRIARVRSGLRAWLVVAAVLALLVPLAFAAPFPSISKVNPAAGRVNESVALTGSNLGKNTVVAVFLSDAKTDHKATIVRQSASEIVMKVPQVKAGGYNVSVQSGGNILILPVRFTVER